LNPNIKKAGEKADQALGKLGLQGIKLHMYDEVFSWFSPGLKEIMKVADGYGVPLLIHATDLDGLAKLCSEYTPLFQ